MSEGSNALGATGVSEDPSEQRTSVGPKAPPSRPVLAVLGRAGLRAAALLSPAGAYRLGGVLGWLYSFFPTRDVRVARVNLELCFPELSEAERRHLRRASFAHTARYFLELGRVWRGAQPGLPGLVREVRGGDVLERALARGKGVLMITPHLGSFEVAGIHLAQEHPLTCIYRVPRVRQMDEMYKHGRERHGLTMVPAGSGAVRSLQRALRRGELAGMLPDQDPGRGGGVFVPFFGHSANTGTLLARMAARSGAPVVAVWAQRIPGGRFDIVFVEGEAEIGDPDPEVGSAAVNRTVERCVREAPEQYLWSYRRFRIQPQGTRSPYRPPRLEKGA